MILGILRFFFLPVVGILAVIGVFGSFGHSHVWGASRDLPVKSIQNISDTYIPREYFIADNVEDFTTSFNERLAGARADHLKIHADFTIQQSAQRVNFRYHILPYLSLEGSLNRESKSLKHVAVRVSDDIFYSNFSYPDPFYNYYELLLATLKGVLPQSSLFELQLLLEDLGVASPTDLEGRLTNLLISRYTYSFQLTYVKDIGYYFLVWHQDDPNPLS